MEILRISFNSWPIFNNIIMRHYQSGSMVDKVHKNVRYMLSEAREIVNRHKTTISNKTSRPLDQSFSLEHLSTKLISIHRQNKPQDQIAKIKIKKRPFSYVLPSTESEETTGRLITVQKKQLPKTSKHSQMKFSSFLNKDEVELIDSSYRKLKKTNNKNLIKNTLLPTIKKSKISRSNTQSSGKYCLTISIEALQKIADQSIRKSLALRTLASQPQVQPIKQATKKKSMFQVTKKLERKSEDKKDDYSQKYVNREKPRQKSNTYYEPWINKQDENDINLL